MNKHKGFTLVELMVVVGIISILLVLVLINLQKTRAGARDRIRVANIDQIRLAVEEYKARCGEYPEALELDTNNGDCPSGFTLASVMPEIPKNPSYTEESVYYRDEFDIDDTFNGYLYAGLSTRQDGPCFEYHVGVPLESNREDDTYEIGQYLKDDHDCSATAGQFDNECRDSLDDFEDANRDARFAVYDFRSANNCS